MVCRGAVTRRGGGGHPHFFSTPSALTLLRAQTNKSRKRLQTQSLDRPVDAVAKVYHVVSETNKQNHNRIRTRILGLCLALNSSLLEGIGHAVTVRHTAMA
jgi:hypothetical protein